MRVVSLQAFIILRTGLPPQLHGRPFVHHGLLHGSAAVSEMEQRPVVPSQRDDRNRGYFFMTAAGRSASHYEFDESHATLVERIFTWTSKWMTLRRILSSGGRGERGFSNTNRRSP